MVRRCGRRVWSLGGALDNVISGQCVFKLSNMTSLPCFLTFFQVHHDISSFLHRITFCLKMFLFILYMLYNYFTKAMQSIRQVKSYVRHICLFAALILIIYLCPYLILTCPLNPYTNPYIIICKSVHATQTDTHT